jgi:hypothetical protein
MNLKLAPVILAVWLATYSLLIGDIQMSFLEEPCYMADHIGTFYVAWPAVAASLPIAGQVIAIGWAVSNRVAHGAWPTPAFTVDKQRALIDCRQSGWNS